MIGNHAVVPASRNCSQVNGCLVARDQFLAFWIVRHIDTLLNDLLIWDANTILIVNESGLESPLAFKKALLMVANL